MVLHCPALDKLTSLQGLITHEYYLQFLHIVILPSKHSFSPETSVSYRKNRLASLLWLHHLPLRVKLRGVVNARSSSMES